MSKLDPLSIRMKTYEEVLKYKILPRSYTIIRVDGKAFHTYTKSLNKPFDKGIVDDMIETTKYLCANIQGAKLGYVQSDEITIVLTDFDNQDSQGWFCNELQKMCSVSGSMVTRAFNENRLNRALQYGLETMKWAEFDSRVIQVPTLIEVNNNLLWRQRDCIRNSVSSCAQALYSHKELENKNVSDMQEMIFQRGDILAQKMKDNGYNVSDKPNFNWNDIPDYLKRGTTVTKKSINKGTEENPIIRTVWETSAFEYSGDSFNLLPIPNNAI